MERKSPFAPRPIITEDLKEPRKNAVFYSIGQVSKKLGISEYKLKKLEDAEHIKPRMRTQGGHRRYAEDQLDDILRIAARRNLRPVTERKPSNQVSVSIDRELYEQIKLRISDEASNISIGRFVSDIIKGYLEQENIEVKLNLDPEAYEGLLSQGGDINATVSKMGKMLKKKNEK